MQKDPVRVHHVQPAVALGRGWSGRKGRVDGAMALSRNTRRQSSVVMGRADPPEGEKLHPTAAVKSCPRVVQELHGEILSLKLLRFPPSVALVPHSTQQRANSVVPLIPILLPTYGLIQLDLTKPTPPCMSMCMCVSVCV